MNYRRPGFPVHGIFQTRVLEWVAISFSRGSSRPRDRTQVRCITGRFFYHLSHQRSPYFMCAAAAKSLQSCPTLCGPIDGSPTGSPVPGILQARILEWVAISFSNAWKWKVKVKSLSCVRLLVTPWTAAYQAPPSMGFSRQEYWSGVPLPSPIFLVCICQSQFSNLFRELTLLKYPYYLKQPTDSMQSLWKSQVHF